MIKSSQSTIITMFKNEVVYLNLKGLLFALFFAGILFAAPLTIPKNQPICNLYGIIKTIGSIGGALVAAYGGLILATSSETNERNNSKQLLAGAIIGLIIIWVAPLIIKNLVNATDICGW